MISAPGGCHAVLIQSTARRERLGPPREIYDLPNGNKRLMWPTQPLGEFTTAADIDASGKVVTVRQVLNENEFYKAQIGMWTKKDVLVNFGRPVETSYFPLMKREVWTYRYMEANVWYMMYSFYFDEQGIVRLTQKTPDPLHDPDRRNFATSSDRRQAEKALAWTDREGFCVWTLDRIKAAD